MGLSVLVVLLVVFMVGVSCVDNEEGVVCLD